MELIKINIYDTNNQSNKTLQVWDDFDNLFPFFPALRVFSGNKYEGAV
jgi:hypothetical protein